MVSSFLSSLKKTFFLTSRKLYSSSSILMLRRTENNIMTPPLNLARNFSRQILSKNLELLSCEKLQIEKDPHSNVPILLSNKERPLVVMLAWMLAEHKHLKKYAEIYFKKGYDVLTITVTPWQLIWPLRGAKLIADEVLQFLHNNTCWHPLILHGFSVGGYIWGEVLVQMNKDLMKYKPVIDRIIGQTWDSVADITELQKGLPNAMFPKSPVLRTTLEKYIGYHLKTFYEEATQHYIRASQMFHTTPIHAPALIFVCNTDPIGSTTSNRKAKESWDSMGIKTYWKCWDESKHVSHFLLHRNEYLETLDTFLSTLDVQKKQQHVKPEKLQIQL